MKQFSSAAGEVLDQLYSDKWEEIAEMSDKKRIREVVNEVYTENKQQEEQKETS